MRQHKEVRINVPPLHIKHSVLSLVNPNVKNYLNFKSFVSFYSLTPFPDSIKTEIFHTKNMAEKQNKILRKK